MGVGRKSGFGGNQWQILYSNALDDQFLRDILGASHEWIGSMTRIKRGIRVIFALASFLRAEDKVLEPQLISEPEDNSCLRTRGSRGSHERRVCGALRCTNMTTRRLHRGSLSVWSAQNATHTSHVVGVATNL